MSTLDTVPTTEDMPAAGRPKPKSSGRRLRPVPPRPLPPDLPDDLHPRHPRVLPDAHDRRPDHGRPGRPARTRGQLAELRAAAGYDRPLIVQYVEYLGQIFTGNFGTTITDEPSGRRGARHLRSRDVRARLLLADRRVRRRHPARPARRVLPRQGAGRDLPRARDLLVRDPDLLRGPAAEAHLLGLAASGFPSPAAPASAPSCRCRRCPNKTGLLHDRRAHDRRPRGARATCSPTPCCPRSRSACSRPASSSASCART